MTLEPGLSRDVRASMSNRLVVQRAAKWIVLELTLRTEQYPAGYGVIIETGNGEEIERVHHLKSIARPGGRVIQAYIPVELLRSDTYIVKLLGSPSNGTEEDVEDYSFQVIRR